MSYSRDKVLLTIKDVTKRYGTKEVLSGVNVQLRDLHSSDAGRIVGQVAALLAPSGTGKSQILQIIAGLEPPTSGVVLINGDQKPVQRGMVGMVFQGYDCWNHRVVMSNLTIPGELAGMTPADAKSRALAYLEAFGLTSDAGKYPGELSGGMRQRISVIRQLMNMDGPKSHPTRLLLMDEPFSALDLNNTQKMCQTIRNVADLNELTSVIVVTHDIRAALSVADMVWLMGRERDAAGNPTSGGKIMRELDLAAMELAWHPELIHTKEFLDCESEIASSYRSL
jgi:polar amino acid transport system ATP-binding protein/sulfate transport system ATP-binding protein